MSSFISTVIVNILIKVYVAKHSSSEDFVDNAVAWAAFQEIWIPRI